MQLVAPRISADLVNSEAGRLNARWCREQIQTEQNLVRSKKQANGELNSIVKVYAMHVDIRPVWLSGVRKLW